MNNYVTFTVAANGEYHDFGKYYTDIEDIGLAKSIYLKLCEDKYILTRPSLGISYGADEEYQIDLVSHGVLYIDIMEHMPAEFRDAEPVKKALNEIREVFPDYIDLSKEADFDEPEI